MNSDLEQLYCKSINKVIKNKRAIENSIGVKLEIKGNIVVIEGAAEQTFIAIQIIEAIDIGFSANQALDLKNEDFILRKLQIKEIAKRNDLSQVRARVIGTKRRALNTIEDLTGCNIVLHDNIIGIIGQTEDVKHAEYALTNLIRGSKHANVYRYLEEQHVQKKLGF